MVFDQAYWTRIYSDLETDIERFARSSGQRLSAGILVDIDRARFAIDKGHSDEAIAILDTLAAELARASGGQARAVMRGGGPGAQSYANLDKLSSELTQTTRLGSARLEITGDVEEAPPAPHRDGSDNTKVNRSTTYDDIKDEYARLFDTASIRAEKQAEVSKMTDKMLSGREVYDAISAKTSVPWHFVGMVHAMECSFSMKKHLHNGDSLNAKTWQVPAGRPKDGDAPFSFEESAIDALEYDKFAGKTDWPLPMILYRLERYNGMAYRKKFGIASPYLWSFTNHHVRGKYVQDGVWDPDALSKQVGAAVMLRELVNRKLVSFDAPQPTVVAQPKPVTPPTPAPVVVQPAPVQQPAPVPQPAAVAQPSPAMQPAPQPVPAPAVQPAPVAAAQPAPAPPQPAPSAPPSAQPPAPPPLPNVVPAAAAAAASAAAAAASAPPAAAPAQPPPAPAAATAPTPPPVAPPSGPSIASVLSAVAAAAAIPKPATPAPLAPSDKPGAKPAVTPSEPETTGT